MRCESDDPAIERAVLETARLLVESGASVDDLLTVRSRDGQLSMHVDGNRTRGRLLVDYPSELTTPLDRLRWSDSPDAMEVTGGADGLSDLHRNLLDLWCTTVNSARKLPWIRSRVAAAAVRDAALRSALADCGFTNLLAPVEQADPKRILSAWHGARGGRLRLIHLKCFVNHHHGGADQRRQVGRTSVIDSGVVAGSEDETFEQYGELDSAQLLVAHGFLAEDPPLVHDTPVEVSDDALGRVRVAGLGPRRAPAGIRPDLPVVSADEDGITLEHLTRRPGGRAPTVAFLAMIVESRTGWPAPRASRHAEALLDTIAAATADRFRRVAELAGRSTSTPAPLRDDLVRLGSIQLTKLERLAG